MAITVRALVEILRNHGVIESLVELQPDGTQKDHRIDNALALLSNAYGISEDEAVLQATDKAPEVYVTSDLHQGI